jgi:hypothetical protein
MFNANRKRPYRDDGGGRYHGSCDRHHYRARAFFQFFPPLGQILTGKGIFADEKMSDFILVLCYKMSANKSKCRHFVTGSDKR